LQDEVKEFVNGIMSCYDSIGLSLSVVYNNELVMAEGFGYSDIENNLLVNRETIFSIGSTSKAFSSALAAISVSDGLMTWDTPVHDYIPDFQLYDEFANERGCVRDLLAHKVGIPRNDILWITYPPWTREEAIPRIRYFPPDRDFRTEYEYNNWMVFMGGYLAAKVQGIDWEEMILERIFKPLNMTSTAANYELAAPLGNLAACYNPTLSGELVRLPDDVNKVITLLAPAGAIHSNAVDMANYMMMQMNNGRFQGKQIIPPLTLAETHRMQTSLTRGQGGIDEADFPFSFWIHTYGFGWNKGSYRGRGLITHSGATIGHISLVSLFSDSGLGIFTSGNSPTNDLFVEMFTHAFIVDLLLELDPWLTVEAACGFPCSVVNCSQEEKSGQKLGTTNRAAELLQKAHELRQNLPEMIPMNEEYAGTYYDPGYDTLSMTWNGTVLYFKFNELMGPVIQVPTEPGELEVLYLLPEYWYNVVLPIFPLMINRDASNNVISITISSFEPNAPPTFFKK